MNDYIVILKESDEPKPRRGRGELYEANLARTAEFQRNLEQWLQEQGFIRQVAGIGEPTAFPMVTLTTTPTVAKMIEGLPEVDLVIQDS